VILALSTAHDACSAALLSGREVVAEMHEVIGRGHDSRLAPMVAALLADTGGPEIAEIWVDVGPGSFTGIRIGLAMGRGLGIALSVPCHGAAGDRIVAARCFAANPALRRVAVFLDARRGELFGRIHTPVGPEGEPVALLPEEARAFARSADAVAGPHSLLTDTSRLQWPGGPRASDMRYLNPADLLSPGPIYVRAPDARLLA